MDVLLRREGVQDYERVLQRMQAFTADRDDATLDEWWLVEHPPVFTQGVNGSAEHLLAPGDIPVVQSDRGGQVTYHGPGQLVLYVLMRLQRARLGVRDLVRALEQAVIDLLGEHGVTAERRDGAPGVYVQDAKIAALGLRVRRGATYHGLSFNVDMDLAPFGRINPCGYAGLQATQLVDCIKGPVDIDAAGLELAQRLAGLLGVTLVEPE